MKDTMILVISTVLSIIGVGIMFGELLLTSDTYGLNEPEEVYSESSYSFMDIVDENETPSEYYLDLNDIGINYKICLKVVETK